MADFLNKSGIVPTSARHKDDTNSNVVTDTVNQGSAVKDSSLISLDKTTTGRGNPINVGTNKALRFEVWGSQSAVFGVRIEGIFKSGTPRVLPIWDIAGNKFVDNNTITAAGLYEVDVQGLTKVQSDVTTITGGSVNGAGVVIA